MQFHDLPGRTYVETRGGPPSLGTSRTSRGGLPAEFV